MTVHRLLLRDASRPLTTTEWVTIIFTTAIQIPVFRHGRHQPAVNENLPNGRRA